MRSLLHVAQGQVAALEAAMGDVKALWTALGRDDGGGRGSSSSSSGAHTGTAIGGDASGAARPGGMPREAGNREGL